MQKTSTLKNSSNLPPVEEKKSFSLPPGIRGFIEETGGIGSFAARFFKQVWRPPYEFSEFIRQCYEIGYRSYPLVAITGFIMGMVLTLQSQPTLANFGAESYLPAMVAVSIIREIGPVISALICAGKVGSGIGAELGSMKVTEQIDAMEVSGTNPFKYLVVTRILATTLMLPVLVIMADGVSMVGSFVGININDDVSLTLYIDKAFKALEFSDLLPSIAKSFFFGFGISLIGCYKGYNAENGTEGVGKASNSAVVASSLMVFIIDAIAVQVTNLFI